MHEVQGRIRHRESVGKALTPHKSQAVCQPHSFRGEWERLDDDNDYDLFSQQGHQVYKDKLT